MEKIVKIKKNQRLVACWVASWEPRENGEFYPDDQVYDSSVVTSIDEAIKAIKSSDRLGTLDIEEKRLVDKRAGIYHWETVAVAIIDGDYVSEFDYWDD